MNHVVIRDPLLNGWEYGMLRSFEKAIVKETGASVMDIPAYSVASKYLQHFGQGMKRGVYRKYFPKQALELKADTAWYILMCPENYRLDLYNKWDNGCKTKILYLYDTLPAQYPLIKRLFSNNTWDILITSFNDAVDDLEKITGRKWHCVEQAADGDLFQPVLLDQRIIHFSSYGRRYPVLHEALKKFCLSKNLYYDYTTHDGKHPAVEAPDLYRQYAWHLTHSLFTFSWPVELTNPQRAGHLHPVTCRWFEAAASGTIILGRPPGNASFEKQLCKDLVVPVHDIEDPAKLLYQLEAVWEKRNELHEQAARLRNDNAGKWTWKQRVEKIIGLTGNV
ncbi:MAG: hypothetical protein NVSMB7_08220 [Chitinophagaceae bacterium]